MSIYKIPIFQNSKFQYIDNFKYQKNKLTQNQTDSLKQRRLKKFLLEFGI